MISHSHPYSVKIFNLHGLSGISSRTTAVHLELYEGYVREANLLNEKKVLMTEGREIDPVKMPGYAEIMKKLAYERNGMSLHEYYFENLKNADGEKNRPGAIFMEKAGSGFGSYEDWQVDFVNKGKVRGVGWAVCCKDPSKGTISNHWISLHGLESLGNLKPVLVMDIWEHAFLLDYQPSEKEKYIKAFFSNINWAVVETRLK